MTGLEDSDSAAVLGEVQRFAREQIRPVAARIDDDDSLPADLLARLGSLGVLGLLSGEEYGGCGGSTLLFTQAVEELAAASASVANLVCSQIELAVFLARFAPAWARVYVPEMVAGSMTAAFALTEPDAGSDVSAIRLEARKVPGGYRLRGSKSFITHAVDAGCFLVFARTAAGPGRGALSAFVVDGTVDNLTRGRAERFLGVRGLGTGSVHFDDCFVDQDRLVAEEGQGFHLAMANLNLGRIAMASEAVGIAREALDQSVRYAQTRHQFGGPIGRLQGVQFMLADMATSVAASRGLIRAAASCRDDGRDYRREASMAKLHASDTAMRVATDAVQIFGAYGYSMDSDVQRLMRDAKITQIYEGTNQIQRVVIARSLLGPSLGVASSAG